MISPSQPPIIINPNSANGDVKACVIWLHGLGADGHDFENIVPQLTLPSHHCIRFIFPTAPTLAVTVNGGHKMNAWYDIVTPNLMNHVDWQGIEESVLYIQQLVNEQLAQGIAADKIILAGFSQGGVIAQVAGLKMADRLAGIMGLSTYLPMNDQLKNSIQQPTTLPVFIGHGTLDPICPYSMAESSLATWHDLGFKPQWASYVMQHQVCAQEIEQMAHFLVNCLQVQ